MVRGTFLQMADDHNMKDRCRDFGYITHQRVIELMGSTDCTLVCSHNSEVDRGVVTGIQISVAIITYCLVAIVQYDMQLNRSTYEVLQILSISLTDKTPLQELFNKTNFNDVKEQFNPLIPGLFD